MKLVILPGLDGAASAREPFADLLRSKFDVEVIGLAEELFRYEDIVNWFLAHHDAPNLVLLGESFSGPLAIQLAAKMGKKCPSGDPRCQLYPQTKTLSEFHLSRPWAGAIQK